MNEPWLRIKIHPWTDGPRQGRLLIAHDRLGARRILRGEDPRASALSWGSSREGGPGGESRGEAPWEPS